MVTCFRDISTWSNYFTLQSLKPQNPEMLEHWFEVNPIINEKVSVWQGDITKVNADVIVNSTKPLHFWTRRGDGDIYDAARNKFVEECQVEGCNLQAIYLNVDSIHTEGTGKQDPYELANCYQNLLKIMLEKSLRSIVFSCGNTGCSAYETENAAHIALYETRKFLSKHYNEIERIVFCVHRHEDLKVYEELLQRYFPVVNPPDSHLTLEDIENTINSCAIQKAKFAYIMKDPKPVRVSIEEILAL